LIKLFVLVAFSQFPPIKSSHAADLLPLVTSMTSKLLIVHPCRIKMYFLYHRTLIWGIKIVQILKKQSQMKESQRF